MQFLGYCTVRIQSRASGTRITNSEEIKYLLILKIRYFYTSHICKLLLFVNIESLKFILTKSHSFANVALLEHSDTVSSL